MSKKLQVPSTKEGLKMSTVKIMIVDDSPFSRTILADELVESGYEVVGEADSIDNLIEVYQESKPDIVTMDIAMPLADGFECSRKLLSHDPDAKILPSLYNWL